MKNDLFISYKHLMSINFVLLKLLKARKGCELNCSCFVPLCCTLDVVRKGTNAWRFLANLTSPVSDGCLAAVEGRLWLVGGQQGVGVTSIVLG